MGLQGIGREDFDWIQLAQYRVQWCDHVNMVQNHRVP